MSHPLHLQCRNGWYYLRLRIPQDLADHFPCTEVRKSLKTQDISLARILKKMYLANIGKIFTLIRTGMLNREQIQNIVRTTCLAQLDLFEERRDAGDRSFVGKTREPILKEDLCRTRESLAELDFHSYRDQVATIIAEHDLEVAEDSVEYQVLYRETLKMRCEMLSIELERSRGNYDNDFDRSLRSKVGLTPAPAHDTNGAVIQIPQPPEKTAPLLSELGKLYTLEKREAKKRKEAVVDEYESQIAFVLKLVGDKPVCDYQLTD